MPQSHPTASSSFYCNYAFFREILRLGVEQASERRGAALRSCRRTSPNALTPGTRMLIGRCRMCRGRFTRFGEPSSRELPAGGHAAVARTHGVRAEVQDDALVESVAEALLQERRPPTSDTSTVDDAFTSTPTIVRDHRRGHRGPAGDACPHALRNARRGDGRGARGQRRRATALPRVAQRGGRRLRRDGTAGRRSRRRAPHCSCAPRTASLTTVRRASCAGSSARS